MATKAYLRVSTDAQDTSSQRSTIDRWAASSNTTIDQWKTDHASGATKWQDRGIASLLDASAPGDVIVVSEISRVARSILGVLSYFQACLDKEVTLIAVRDNIVFRADLQSKVLITQLALVAEIERHFIRERTAAAIQAKRARGEKLGRRVGQVVKSKLDSRREEIVRCLAAKVSKRAIARMLDVSPSTLYAWLDKSMTPNSDPHTKDIFNQLDQANVAGLATTPKTLHNAE